MKAFKISAIMLIGTCGMVFAQGTSTVAVLHDFAKFGDGQRPYSALISDTSGNLYGTTSLGGDHGLGAVFELKPATQTATTYTESILYSFSGGADGSDPVSGLVMDKAGNLYGTTERGGPRKSGIVFMLSPPAPGYTSWGEKVLHGFAGAGGARPTASLILDARGDLFGTTSAGGSHQFGTIFQLSPPKEGQSAWTKKVLFNFDDYVLGCPMAALTSDGLGNLYGTTSGCGGTGAGYGMVFKLTPPAKGQSQWVETNIWNFLDDNFAGHAPYGPVTIDTNGVLYGTTTTGNFSAAYGAVFMLTPPQAAQSLWTETLIHGFSTPSDGALPTSSLIWDGHGSLWGTTQRGGGGFDQGTVFKLAPPVIGQAMWTETLFPLDSASGTGPAAGLLLRRSDGSLIGTAAGGGTHGLGTVFSIAP